MFLSKLKMLYCNYGSLNSCKFSQVSILTSKSIAGGSPRFLSRSLRTYVLSVTPKFAPPHSDRCLQSIAYAVISGANLLLTQKLPIK